MPGCSGGFWNPGNGGSKKRPLSPDESSGANPNKCIRVELLKSLRWLGRLERELQYRLSQKNTTTSSTTNEDLKVDTSSEDSQSLQNNQSTETKESGIDKATQKSNEDNE